MNKLLIGKTGYLVGFVLCFAIVALALVIQTQFKLEPCPLCISQRMVFMGLGLLFLIAAFIPPASFLKNIFTLIYVSILIVKRQLKNSAQ